MNVIVDSEVKVVALVPSGWRLFMMHEDSDYP
jgi:hypothetical protein